MNYILYDGDTRRNLLPLTFTRPVAEIRIGILTIRQKWERLLQTTVSCFTEPYLREKYPFRSAGENILINASVLPGKDLAAAVGRLKPGQSIQQKGILLAAWLDEQQLRHLSEHPAGSEGPAGQGESIEWTAPLIGINHSEDIFRFNGGALLAEFELITRKRRSARASGTNRVQWGGLLRDGGVQRTCIPWQRRHRHGRRQPAWSACDLRRRGGKNGCTALRPHYHRSALYGGRGNQAKRYLWPFQQRARRLPGEQRGRRMV